ncbi:MAG: hypothetical protein Kow006_06060 [Gammaproteobacteria bacterium]
MTARQLPLALVAAALLLSACSPHPGSGEWVADPQEPDNYSRLKVEFDGKAFLFVPGREEHLVRCFWAGADKQTINMDCMVNDPSERRIAYQLRVVSDTRSELREAGIVLARFRRK